MNRMTGLILMSAGVLFFLAGALIYNSSKNSKSTSFNNVTAEKPVEKENVESTISEDVILEPDNELEKAIEMAIADGVLSNNERKILNEIAIRKGFDFKKVIKDVERQLAESDVESETELVDNYKKQGDDFEKFVVQKFDKRYYRIKEWAGDKYVNGVFAETTTQPDILISKETKKESAEFWMECKWRQNYTENGVQFASEEQFKRYKNYEETRKIPVFIALGIGGKGIKPDKFCMVPLRLLTSNFIYAQTLNHYEKELDKNLYYTSENRYINSSSR